MTAKIKKLVSRQNKRAHAKGIKGVLEYNSVLQVWDATIFCNICGAFIEDEDASIDHNEPLASGGRNELDNIHFVHYWCNNFKGDKNWLNVKAKWDRHYEKPLTGSIVIDSGAGAFLHRWLVNPPKRSNLSSNFASLSYFEQILIVHPNIKEEIEREQETLSETRKGRNQ